MQFQVNDGVWVRLDRRRRRRCRRARYSGDGEIVLEVTDAFLPENAGRWRVGADGAERTDAAAELRLDVTGARLRLSRRLHVRATSCARSGREELADGAAERARRALPHRHRAVVRRDLLT